MYMPLSVREANHQRMGLTSLVCQPHANARTSTGLRNQSLHVSHARNEAIILLPRPHLTLGTFLLSKMLQVASVYINSALMLSLVHENSTHSHASAYLWSTAH